MYAALRLKDRGEQCSDYSAVGHSAAAVADSNFIAALKHRWISRHSSQNPAAINRRVKPMLLAL